MASLKLIQPITLLRRLSGSMEVGVVAKDPHFMWRVLNDALPVRGKLVRIGLEISPYRPRCNS